MKTVNYETYTEEKLAFIKKHGSYKLTTSAMNEVGGYHKDYCFDDGASFTECMNPVEEEVEAKAHGLTFKVTVKMMETEYWDTDNSTSRFLYERW